MLRQLFTFLLLFSFLFSHIGLTSAKHYCGDFLAAEKLGLLPEIPTCGMEMGNASCSSAKNSATETGCCHNYVEQLKAETELQKVAQQNFLFSPAVQLPAAVFVMQVFNLTGQVQTIVVPAISHSPPHEFSSLRLQAFLQLFLI